MPESRVKSVLSQVFNIPIEQIDASSSPDTIEKWNSLGHMNMVIALEEEFGISFSEEQIIEMLNYPLVVYAVKEAAEA